jgi:hypothetical protein
VCAQHEFVPCADVCAEPWGARRSSHWECGGVFCRRGVAFRQVAGRHSSPRHRAGICDGAAELHDADAVGAECAVGYGKAGRAGGEGDERDDGGLGGLGRWCGGDGCRLQASSSRLLS